jgi:CRISPR-associated protein Csd2
MAAITSRYDFVYLFDVQDGNPNGDPDAGNLPRIDAETGKGLVTDVCLKRKVRNYVLLAKPGADRLDIFVKEKAILNRAIVESWDEANKGKSVKTAEEKRAAEDGARARMCSRFYDIRAFGAVLSTSDKEKAGESEDDKKLRKTAGQVRGPIQLTFGRSIDPVVTLEHSITRMAVTNEKDLEKERTMGRKFTIPYGLYQTHGFISPFLAAQTGFSDGDLILFWDALKAMFEHDRSAARGMMSARKLVVFKHDSPLGNAPAHSLFDLVKVDRAKGSSGPARSFSDYEILAPADMSKVAEGKVEVSLMI